MSGSREAAPEGTQRLFCHGGSTPRRAAANSCPHSAMFKEGLQCSIIFLRLQIRRALLLCELSFKHERYLGSELAELGGRRACLRGATPQGLPSSLAAAVAALTARMRRSRAPPGLAAALPVILFHSLSSRSERRGSGACPSTRRTTGAQQCGPEDLEGCAGRQGGRARRTSKLSRA